MVASSNEIRGAYTREIVLGVGFVLLLLVGAVTVASPELADAPEEAGTSREGSGQVDAGVAPPTTP